MKNKTLQICSLVGLAIIFAATSISAQGIKKYEAEIPFDFEVGGEIYESGDYALYISTPSNLATVLTIRNADGRELYRAALIKNGKTAKRDKTSLVFERYGGQFVFSRIAAPQFGFNLWKSKRAKRLAKKWKGNRETVSVLIRKPKEMHAE